MNIEPKSIAEHIDSLAQLTGAPQSFVMQVKELFSRKGIPLDADAAPYLRALEEAFKREESIRTSAQRARRNIARLAENFNKIGKSYVRQLEHLRKIQSGLQEQGRQAERVTPTPNDPARPGRREERRPLMLRQDSDKLPMVPGPKEEQ